MSQPRARTQTCLLASSHMTQNPKGLSPKPPLARSSAALSASENLLLSLTCAWTQVCCPGTDAQGYSGPSSRIVLHFIVRKTGSTLL